MKKIAIACDGDAVSSRFRSMRSKEKRYSWQKRSEMRDWNMEASRLC